MDMGRVKNVIIVLLLVVNALLAAVLLARAAERAAAERAAFSDAQAALARLGCVVSDELLKRQYEPAYTLESERKAESAQLLSGYVEDIEYEQGVAYAGGVLLGEVYTVGKMPSKSQLAAMLVLAADLPYGLEIVAVERGYFAEPMARGYHTLTPAWRIETSMGVYTLNALTLEVLLNP